MLYLLNLFRGFVMFSQTSEYGVESNEINTVYTMTITGMAKISRHEQPIGTSDLTPTEEHKKIISQLKSEIKQVEALYTFSAITYESFESESTNNPSSDASEVLQVTIGLLLNREEQLKKRLMELEEYFIVKADRVEIRDYISQVTKLLLKSVYLLSEARHMILHKSGQVPAFRATRENMEKVIAFSNKPAFRESSEFVEV